MSRLTPEREASLRRAVMPGGWLEEAVAEIDALRAEVADYKTLTKVGKWHSECRPNRNQAAQIIRDLEATIDTMADAVSASRDALALCARQDAEKIVQLQQQLKAAKDEMTDWILVADGVKHDWRCVHGEADTPLCLRCQIVRLRHLYGLLLNRARGVFEFGCACGDVFDSLEQLTGHRILAHGPVVTDAPDPVEAFYAAVNARAEHSMLQGRGITGAHHRALEAEIAAYRALHDPKP